MSIKKRYPIELLKLIEPIALEAKDYIKPDLNSKNYRLIDKSHNSGYYFEIDEKFDNNRHIGAISFKPRSGHISEGYGFGAKIEEIGKHLTTWINNVKESTDIVSIYDDPIVEGFQKEFLDEIKIDETDYSPISFKEIPKLEAYIKILEKGIEELEESGEKEEMKLLCADLKSNITKKSKTSLLKTITKIWALSAKTKGYEYTKYIMQKFVEAVPGAIAGTGITALLG